MWYAAYAFKMDDRTVSKSTLYAFWYAVRFSVAIVVPFIAAYKVYKSYTCSIFGMSGCFWYAYTVFRMRPFHGTLYCISYACTIFRLASVFGTHTVLYLVRRAIFGTYISQIWLVILYTVHAYNISPQIPYDKCGTFYGFLYRFWYERTVFVC